MQGIRKILIVSNYYKIIISIKSNYNIIKERIWLEIRIKPEEKDEKPSIIRNLLNNGLKGKYVLQSITQDTENGEFVFRYKKRK